MKTAYIIILSIIAIIVILAIANRKKIIDLIVPDNDIKDEESPVPYNNEFPVRFGSRGAKVRTIQNILINKYGKNVLPKYGADGIFGQETALALLNNSLPTSFTETVYRDFLAKYGK